MKPHLETANAGLVILAPFLIRYFSMLDVQPGKSQRGRTKAALHLHYLATGDPVAENLQLALPKLLSGIDPGEIVSGNLEVNDIIVAESDALLQAVITQWSSLGDTGIVGLRDTFLQRSGMLEIDASHVVLSIPRQAQDVLLDGLPWSFRLIHLPWMSRQLKVEW